MDTITAANIVRNTLRTYLSDPWELAGGTYRGGSYWIFTDEPLLASKYPQIKILKVDNPTAPIEIGSNYMEKEELFLNIWFYSKNGFKITVSGTEYANAQMVEYYLGQIKSTLKAQFTTMYNQDVGMYKSVNTTPIEYDPETQLYFAAVTVRVAFFHR